MIQFTPQYKYSMIILITICCNSNIVKLFGRNYTFIIPEMSVVIGILHSFSGSHSPLNHLSLGVWWYFIGS